MNVKSIIKEIKDKRHYNVEIIDELTQALHKKGLLHNDLVLRERHLFNDYDIIPKCWYDGESFHDFTAYYIGTFTNPDEILSKAQESSERYVQCLASGALENPLSPYFYHKIIFELYKTVEVTFDIYDAYIHGCDNGDTLESSVAQKLNIDGKRFVDYFNNFVKREYNKSFFMIEAYEKALYKVHDKYKYDVEFSANFKGSCFDNCFLRPYGVSVSDIVKSEEMKEALREDNYKRDEEERMENEYFYDIADSSPEEEDMER